MFMAFGVAGQLFSETAQKLCPKGQQGVSRSETDRVQRGHISSITNHRRKPFGLFLEIGVAEMKACRILITLRGLRGGSRADFGGNRRTAMGRNFPDREGSLEQQLRSFVDRSGDGTAVVHSVGIERPRPTATGAQFLRCLRCQCDSCLLPSLSMPWRARSVLVGASVSRADFDTAGGSCQLDDGPHFRICHLAAYDLLV